MQFGGGGGERGILWRRRAVDGEVRAGQRLENGVQGCGIGEPVVRPGETAAQYQRHAIDDLQIVDARAELASGVGGIHRSVRQPEAAAGEIGLAVARRMEVLRLQRGIRRHPDDDAGDRHGITIAAFEPRSVALADEGRPQLIAERNAVGGEPVIGEGERGREIGRTGMRLGIDAGLEGIAAAAAQALRQSPVGAAAGEAEAVSDAWRGAIFHARSEAIVARGDIVGADCGIAVGRTGAAEGRAPRRPAPFEALRSLVLLLQRLGISKRDIARQARILLRRETCRAGAAGIAAAARSRIKHQIEEVRHQLIDALAGIGCRFAVEMRQSIEIAGAGQSEQLVEAVRYRIAGKDRSVDAVDDVLLVLVGAQRCCQIDNRVAVGQERVMGVVAQRRRA